ncbi:MAG: glycosyltransferase family 4 protein [Desulfovibrio sp.]|jgi:glycosyltransferase involved in cell wall biosynthesis|nr:glycosyltransferase family 4 protein [Desulfovibrio sp.]
MKKTSPLQHPIRVLAFYDNKRGAWWNCFSNMQKKFSESVLFDFIEIYTNFNPQGYDYFLVPEAYLLPLVSSIPPAQIIGGSNCPLLFDSSHQAHKEGRFYAAMYNCELMYAKAHDMLPMVFYGPRGVDTDFFSPAALPPETFTACWVGNSRSIGQKGLDLIKKACAIANVPLRYLDSAECQHPLTHDQIRDQYYRKASVYVCASASEGTPNPALEALACGLPVITTRVGNMPELIVEGHNGIFIQRNVESIVDALHTVKSMDITVLRANARDGVLNGWTWKEQTMRYEDAFKAIAASMGDRGNTTATLPNSYRKLLLLSGIRKALSGELASGSHTLLRTVKYTAFWRMLRIIKKRLTALCLAQRKGNG